MILFIGKNAVVVIVAAAIAWTLDYTDNSGYIELTGNLTEGIPPFKPPEFNLPDAFQVSKPLSLNKSKFRPKKYCCIGVT